MQSVLLFSSLTLVCLTLRETTDYQRVLQVTACNEMCVCAVASLLKKYFTPHISKKKKSLSVNSYDERLHVGMILKCQFIFLSVTASVIALNLHCRTYTH